MITIYDDLEVGNSDGNDGDGNGDAQSKVCAAF